MSFSQWMWGIGPEWWLGAWGSVVLPLLVTCYAAWRHGPELNIAFWSLASICCIASILSGQWEHDGDNVSLHMLPVFFISLAFVAYWKASVPPLVAYAGCFLSLATADVISAVAVIGPTQEGLEYLRGVGGAGLKDGLFMFPLFSLCLQIYVRWRSKAPKLKTDSL